METYYLSWDEAEKKYYLDKSLFGPYNRQIIYLKNDNFDKFILDFRKLLALHKKTEIRTLNSLNKDLEHRLKKLFNGTQIKLEKRESFAN